MRFELYLQSGPQHKRTWVTVPAWPGTIAFGSTTEEALANTPDAIRRRFDFLRDHGEAMPDPEPIELDVVDHQIERKLLGFGQNVPTDREPVSRPELETALRWAGWSREALVEAARAQKISLMKRPSAGGRSAAAILGHVAGAEVGYVNSVLGSVTGGTALVNAVEAAGADPWVPFKAEREAVIARLEAMTAEELTRVTEREGKPPRTARRMLRRMLEHEWEHLLELQARL